MKTSLSRLRVVRTSCALVLLASACAMPAHAGWFSNNTKLVGNDSVAGDWAGDSVAISADNSTLIFGAPQAPVNGVSGAGKVYVFTRNADGTWTQQGAALTEPGTPGSDGLGTSVALSADGNTAIIGAPGATVSGKTYSGKVYVFTRTGSTWKEQTSFSAPTSALGGGFGDDIALSGDAQTLLIGAPQANTQVGAVYAYTQSKGTWSAPSQLNISGAAAKSFIGTLALSADGNTALIGAKGVGKAYFFARNGSTWSQGQELSDPGSNGDEFGAAVALSGNGQTAAVGAYNTLIAGLPTPWGIGAGEAYIYSLTGGTWSLQKSIPNPLTQTGNKQGGFQGQFGTALSLSADGNTALITANQVGAPAPASGQAFIYTRSNGAWAELKEIDDPGQQAGDHFGGSAALNSAGDTAVVGLAAGSGTHPVWVTDSPADLSLALTADHSTVSPGQSLTYMLTATNTDAEVTATHVTVANTLPSGVTATHTTTGCTGTTGIVTCVDAALSPGATYQPSITVTAPANATGVPFNMPDAASVSGDQLDLNATNNGANVDTIVLAGSGGTAPVASDSSITTPENTAATGTLLATGSGLTFTIVGQPAHGTVKATNAATGTFSYAPAPGYAGADSFTFTATNSDGTSNTATETIMVSASGNGGSTPVASSGSATTTVGQEANGSLNATGSGALTFTIVAKPSHGTATLTDAAKGTFTYTPDSGYSGADGFAFTAQNSAGASNIAVETVTISAKSSGSSSSGDSNSGSSGKSGGGALGFLSLSLLGIALGWRRRWNA